MEGEEKLSSSLSYFQSRGCSWAQHNTAKPLLTSKKIHIFPPPCRKHCRIGPLGKGFPKREAFQPGERPLASLGQEEGGHGQEPGQGNATSWQPPQGPEDTTKLLGSFGTCFCCFGVVLSRLTPP